MNAVLAIVYTEVPGFPTGSVVDHIACSITGAATPILTANVAPGTASAEFANVPADTYTFSVVAQDAAGNDFGTPVTGSFTITAPATMTLNIPSSVTASQT